MKRLLILSLLLLILPIAHAQVLSIDQTEKNSVIVTELANPAEYILFIKNNGQTDSFEIYTFAGFSMTPKGTFILEAGETTKLDIAAYPTKEILKNYKGAFTFDYEIRSSKNGITQDKLKVNIVELKDLFGIIIKDISPKDTQANIQIENLGDIEINNLTIIISSPFFEIEESLSITPRGVENLVIDLDKEKLSKLVAGNYEADIKIIIENHEADKKIPFNYLESEGVSVYTDKEGFIIIRETSSKTNIGNTPITVKITDQKNILSRLFTTFSETPLNTVNEGFTIEYIWERELTPGESLTVQSRTNYTLPFVIILLIVLIVIGTKIILETPLVVRKRVSLVKTKGDHLALKIRISLKAKKSVDSIELTDSIPRMAKLYDQFAIRPDKLDPHARRLHWNLKSMRAGEERAFSYIIYSKIKIVGRLELPAAIVSYTKDNKKQEIYSNKTYFASETSPKE